jgi:hypothetical protein
MPIPKQARPFLMIVLSEFSDEICSPISTCVLDVGYRTSKRAGEEYLLERCVTYSVECLMSMF